MRRVLVVINPSSSDFEAERRFPELEPVLRALADVTVLSTDKDDAKTLASIAEVVHNGFDRVIAIGGDGTAHLVLNGMLSSGTTKLPELAMIPFGTANNVSKSLGLPLNDLPRLARIAVGDTLGKLDVGSLRATHGTTVIDRFWINCATIGMDADVLAAREGYRDLGGYLAYAAAIAERAVEQHSFDARITIDDAPIDVRVFNAVITNVPIYAGELAMPGAQRDDGLLDLYLFNRQEYASKLLSMLIKTADVLKLGVSEALEDITENQRTHHARSFKIRLASPHQVQVDGELLGKADEVECEAIAQLKVAIP